ncbi:MAG: BatD family protein, partial [Deltaproteobacteria bacterium]|nr:BatD family protein [Deltaproteobacteria bacterium]
VVKSQKSGINAVPSPTPQAQPPGSSTRLEESEIGQTAFLRVIPATHRPYVGETVPVEIRAYFRRGVRATVNSLPVPEGSVFSFQSISEKPRQTEETIKGEAFSVLTWNAVMSAVKEGEYPLNIYIDATLLVPDTSRRRPFLNNSFFDNSFFDNFFESVRKKEVNIKSTSRKMRVLPLPKAGRPDNFSGAVGNFTLSAEATPKESMLHSAPPGDGKPTRRKRNLNRPAAPATGGKSCLSKPSSRLTHPSKRYPLWNSATLIQRPESISV